MAEIGALQSGAKRRPDIAAVLGGEESVVVKGQHDEGAFRMFAVHGDVGDVLVLEAVVGGSKRSAAIVADLHALAFGADDDALGVLGIDEHCVDDPVARSNALEIFFVNGLPQAAGGSRVEHIGIRGIHADQLRAAEGVGNALILDPLLRAVGAVINAGAGGGVNVIRIRRINDDAHHVGVINHALHNREPVLAAIGGLPGKVIRAGVHDIVVFHVESDGVKILQVGMIVGRNFCPACAFVRRAINAGQRTGEKQFRIRWRLREGANGFVRQANDVPGMAGVIAAIDAAAVRIQRPGAGVQTIGIAWINNDVSDDVVLGSCSAAEQLPVCTLVAGSEDVTIGGAEIKFVDVVGIRGERNDSSAGWSNLVPSLSLGANYGRHS